jgi:hypothetical protein
MPVVVLTSAPWGGFPLKRRLTGLSPMPFPAPQSPFTAIYRGGPILGPAHKKGAPAGRLG